MVRLTSFICSDICSSVSSSSLFLVESPFFSSDVSITLFALLTSFESDWHMDAILNFETEIGVPRIIFAYHITNKANKSSASIFSNKTFLSQWHHEAKLKVNFETVWAANLQTALSVKAFKCQAKKYTNHIFKHNCELPLNRFAARSLDHVNNVTWTWSCMNIVYSGPLMHIASFWNFGPRWPPGGQLCFPYT